MTPDERAEALQLACDIAYQVRAVKPEAWGSKIIATIRLPDTAREKDFARWLPNAEFIANARSREPQLARAALALAELWGPLEDLIAAWASGSDVDVAGCVTTIHVQIDRIKAAP